MIRRAALAASALLVLAAPAAGANGVRITSVDTSDYPTMHVSLVTTGGLSQPPSLRENDHGVDGLQSENLGRQKSVVLAVDNSRSMAGKALADASAAARAFVAAKPGADQTVAEKTAADKAAAAAAAAAKTAHTPSAST